MAGPRQFPLSLTRCITELRSKVTVHSIPATRSIQINFVIRMIFLLWLVAVVSASENMELQTNSPHIAPIVNKKNVRILLEDEFDGVVESATGEIDTTDMPDSLVVYQEINKLDDIVRDENPIIVNEAELASKNEELELNEISNNLGEDDIVDVIHNFIADKDPMLQVIYTDPFKPYYVNYDLECILTYNCNLPSGV